MTSDNKNGRTLTRRLLEPPLVQLEISKTDALGPSPGSYCELEIIRTMYRLGESGGNG